MVRKVHVQRGSGNAGRRARPLTARWAGPCAGYARIWAADRHPDPNPASAALRSGHRPPPRPESSAGRARVRSPTENVLINVSLVLLERYQTHIDQDILGAEFRGAGWGRGAGLGRGAGVSVTEAG